MENQKQLDELPADKAKFPKWIWLFALVGMTDFFAYLIMLFAGLPSAYWWSTLMGTWGLLFAVGIQGFLSAFVGTILLTAAQKFLIKNGFSLKRAFIFNAVGFFLIGIIPVIVFLPDNKNSDYAMGMAFLPVFFYPFFNAVRFIILLAATFLYVKTPRPS